MNNIETMKLALEALEMCTNQGMISMYLNKNKEAITSLRQAIEQAQQAEPVAYRCWNNPQNADGTFDILRIWVSTKPEGYGNEPLYTAPPVASNDTSQHRVDETAKQEHEQAEKQEPVRVMGFNCVCGRRMEVSAEQGVVPAPARQPLTDEEIERLVDDEDWYNDPHGFARAIEAKLRSKNT